MTTTILLGTVLFAASVALQMLAILALARYLLRHERHGRLDLNLWYTTGIFSGGMLILFAGHLLQVYLWARVFMWVGEFDDLATAFYHSTVNFSSLGYGDIVMSERWRLLGAMEATCGILMFGISTGAGFAVFNAVLRRVLKRPDHVT